MYLDYFGLSAKPFQLTPDHRFLYLSPAHKKAVAYLRYGLTQAEGFIVVTGDIGTGKSTLVRNLFATIDTEKLTAAQLVTTQLDANELLGLVSAAFKLPYANLTKAELLAQFQGFLRAECIAGRRVLLVIDEAQNLPIRTLEELRMLSNFEAENQPLLQCFLLGQKEFRITLGSPQLEQLRQRVIASTDLRPLSKADTTEYIHHRLRLCGWNDNPIIEADCFTLIQDFTNGTPRKINLLMDRILLYVCLEELIKIDSSVVSSVIEELQAEDYVPANSITDEERLSSPDPLEPRLAALEQIFSDSADLLRAHANTIDPSLRKLP